MCIPTSLVLQQISANSCTGSQKGLNSGVASAAFAAKKKNPSEEIHLGNKYLCLQNPIVKWFLKRTSASAVSPAQSIIRTAILGREQEPQGPASPLLLSSHQQLLRKGYENRASVE